MKDDSVYLIHILECIKQIEEYTINGREEFMNSRLIQDAVIRNIEVIGEATKQVSPGLRRQHPEIPWKEMAGMRDVLIHDYMGVDLKTVWKVLQKRLPGLKPLLKGLISTKKD